MWTWRLNPQIQKPNNRVAELQLCIFKYIDHYEMELLKLLQKPFYQVLLFVLVTVFALAALHVPNASDAWSIAGYIFIIFMLINAVLLWFASIPWRYFFHSICFGLMYLLLISILMPGLLKLLQLNGSVESAAIFLFIIYQPGLLLAALIFRWVHYKIMKK